MSHLDTPVVAVVVAAGSGSRLGASQPKALVKLEGVTLVRHSVDALVAGGVEQVVVTVPHGLESEFRAAMDGAAVPTACVEGGSTRQDSVRIGLAALTAPDRAVVLVHDAARALIPPTVVRAVASAVANGAEVVIPVLPVVDSIRRIDGASSLVVDRAPLRAVQTPQGARLGELRRAHDLLVAEALEVTDDAAACEHAGLSVTLVDGHRDALKITEPVDLVLAGAILAARDHSHQGHER